MLMPRYEQRVLKWGEWQHVYTMFIAKGLTYIRTHVGMASCPLNTDYVDIAMIKNTVSLSWRIGRAIALARKQSSLSRIGSILVDAVGGSKSAKVLFMGKITDVRRRSVFFLLPCHAVVLI
jgi:DUF917 family protein